MTKGVLNDFERQAIRRVRNDVGVDRVIVEEVPDGGPSAVTVG
jgi:hypothetical protein